MLNGEMISVGPSRKLKKELTAMLELVWDERMASRKGAKTLSLKML
jgi:hypothetical protein